MRRLLFHDSHKNTHTHTHTHTQRLSHLRPLVLKGIGQVVWQFMSLVIKACLPLVFIVCSIINSTFDRWEFNAGSILFQYPTKYLNLPPYSFPLWGFSTTLKYEVIAWFLCDCYKCHLFLYFLFLSVHLLIRLDCMYNTNSIPALVSVLQRLQHLLVVCVHEDVQWKVFVV